MGYLNKMVLYKGEVWWTYEVLTQYHRYIDGIQIQFTLSNYAPGTPYSANRPELFVCNVPIKDLEFL